MGLWLMLQLPCCYYMVEILQSGSSSSSLDSDAWVTNGIAAELILHAAAVVNDGDVVLVAVL